MGLIHPREHKPTVFPQRHVFTVREKLGSITQLSLLKVVVVLIIEFQYIINTQLTA